MSALPKPILFLDFDRTLFDTEKFLGWLGSDRFAGILELMSGRREPPDFAKFLYPDTLPFLTEINKSYRLVLLSYAVNVLLQRRKVRGSGMAAIFDDIIITSDDKGISAKEYVARFHASGWRHVFVDDAPENISDMKKVNPDFYVVQIIRAGERVYGALPLGPDKVVTNLPELRRLLLELPPHLHRDSRNA